MIRVNASVFRQAMLLWPLIVLPSVALADAGHDAKKEPVAMEGMDHSKMKMDGQGDTAAASAHWMAPEAAAKRPNPVKASNASRARGKRLRRFEMRTRRGCFLEVSYSSTGTPILRGPAPAWWTPPSSLRR